MLVKESGLLVTLQQPIDTGMTSASSSTCTMHAFGGLWHG